MEKEIYNNMFYLVMGRNLLKKIVKCVLCGKNKNIGSRMGQAENNF